MTSIRTPEPAIDRAFALAIERAQALMGGPRGGGPGGLGAADRISLATALLGAGVRAPAREMLRPAQEAGASGAALGERDSLSRLYRAWVGETGGAEATAASFAMSGDFRGPTPVDVAAGALARNPDDPAAIAAVLDAVVHDLWGVVPDAPAAAVALRPAMPAHWPSMALARLRIGRTLLDVELRRRRDALVARVHRAGGPPLIVTFELDPPLSGPTFVDDVELRGPRVRFEAVERHEIVAHVPPA